MTSIESTIADNHRRVRERIESACQRCGRDPASVRLIAVTKYAEMTWIEALAEIGVTDFAESRPQQLAERVPLLPERIHWHLIGHLQRNKVRSVLPITTMIHSVDTMKLLKRIDLLANELNLIPTILVQVNISAEAQKDGFTVEELVSNWKSILELEHVQVDGLMTMAPYSERSQDAGPIFERLRELRTKLVGISPESLPLPQLSMGMSGDFEVAIEEGATLIRIGGSLFEGLQGQQ